MTGPRHIATSALALGAAILAVTVLQSAPAEARRAGAHSRVAKSHGPIHTRLVRHRLKSNKSLTSGNNTAGVGNVANTSLNTNGGQITGGGNVPKAATFDPNNGGQTTLGGPKTVPINPNGGQTTTGVGNVPKTAPFNPNSGAVPINPTGGQITTSVDKIPTTHFNPPIDPGGQLPTNPNGGQTTTGGGTSQPPIVCITQPCPPTSGNNQPTSGGHNHAHKGHVAGPGYVYGGASAPLIESGASTTIAAEAYAPCLWLKRNYDLTANVEWLNRYKQCLSWHHSD